MDVNSLFIEATREKFRFEYRGLNSTEDLWDLSLEALDTIYRNLKKHVQKEDSLLTGSKSRESEFAEKKMAVVKAIFDIRVEEQNKAKADALKRANNQKILEIMARKKDKELEEMSIDQLQAMLDE